jgi:hypothetical protein
LRGVNAATVHTGLANLYMYNSLPNSAFLRHTQSWN